MSPWRSQELRPDHDLDGFDSGREELDRWLRVESLRAQAAGTAHTTVWTDEGEGEGREPGRAVVAYYSVAPTQFVRAELPSRSLAGGYSVIPGYLIARLALDRALQGRGLGSQLLVDSLERIVAAAGTAGGRLIAVDALDRAAHRFYRRHDFQPIEEGSTRLLMKVATARAALN